MEAVSRRERESAARIRNVAVWPAITVLNADKAQAHRERICATMPGAMDSPVSGRFSDRRSHYPLRCMRNGLAGRQA